MASDLTITAPCAADDWLITYRIPSREPYLDSVALQTCRREARQSWVDIYFGTLVAGDEGKERTDDEGCAGEEADVEELDAPVAHPLDASAAHQQVELTQRPRDGPVPRLFAPARRPPAAQPEMPPRT